jgi:hypothetical protein
VAEQYRVIDETVREQARVYMFADSNGDIFTRSCPRSQAPFLVGMNYTMAEIDACAPDQTLLGPDPHIV